ncbi:hypothetical protein K6U06_00345 [Acidiferrimicrobium sp. IK]|nr:hypothetical protein [Acidiferrimicrobium sp. IK]
MARGLQLTFDCTDPHRLAGWWAALLGGKVEDNHSNRRRLFFAGAGGRGRRDLRQVRQPSRSPLGGHAGPRRQRVLSALGGPPVFM